VQVQLHDSMDEGGEASPRTMQLHQPPPAFPLLRVATDPAVRSAAEADCLAERGDQAAPAGDTAAASLSSKPAAAALRTALTVVRSAGGNGAELPQLARALAAADAVGERLYSAYEHGRSRGGWCSASVCLSSPAMCPLKCLHGVLG
jgi:hypothetical protein